MNRLQDEQDTILLAMYCEGKIVDYYLVSLEILRLFPLSYLNEMFPAGIPFGSFLTGHQVLDLYSLVHTPTPSTLLGNDSCTKLFSPEEEMDEIRRMYDSDGSEYHEFDSHFKYLFEKITSVTSDIAMQKSVHVHTDQALFDYFGKYFQKVIQEQVSELDKSHFSFDDANCKEFMFFKEQIDLYCVQLEKDSPKIIEKRKNSLEKSKENGFKIVFDQAVIDSNTFGTTCKEYLMRHQDIHWFMEGLEKPSSIIEFMKMELNHDIQWDILRAVDYRRTILKYCTVPLHSKRVEKQLSSDEIMVSNLITQVSKTETYANVQDAIKNRDSFRQTHWQKIPAVQLKKKKEQLVGTLWMRRTWSLEFSRTFS